MRIVFGWNHFKLRSFSPPELGIPNPSDTPFTIELRQRYFHLFYIPFFSIGKLWAIRKKNGVLYDMPAPLMVHIHQQGVPEKTPWYTFAGPILIVAGIIIYGFSEKVENIRQVHRAEKAFESRAALLTDALAKTDSHSYYLLKENGTMSNTLLKVTEVKGADITCSMLSTGLYEYELSPMKIQSLFAIKGDAAEKITINKQRLLSAIPLKYEDANKGTDLLGNSRLFTIHEIYHLDGPLITNGHSSSMSNNKLSFDLVNSGWPGTLTKIVTLSGGYNWAAALPKTVLSAKNDYDATSQIRLTGTLENAVNRKYKIELTMLDTLQKEHKYVVEGTGFERAVNQVY